MTTLHQENGELVAYTKGAPKNLLPRCVNQWIGLLMGGISLFAQGWAYFTGCAHWQSMVFTVLALSQMGHVLAIRSERESLFSQGLFSNMPLWALCC